MDRAIYLAIVVGTLFGAGFVGSHVAEKAHQNGITIANLGFWSGTAGGLFVSAMMLCAWVGGHVSVQLHF